ncbi:NB-ARC domain-containing protein [Actinoplanes sp. URMC 104]|uniref:NB-ARC domain-containing protein n=1 Tax=Actinoplanes sp. URMC 104 TaxID=3423409 RepID=UPI003F1E2AD3
MLETIGGAVLEWIVGETLNKTRTAISREPQVRDLDKVIRKAVEPATAAATSDPVAQSSLSDALTERLVARLDISPGDLRDPAASVRRWLAPLGEPIVGGISYWENVGVDGELVMDALATEVVRGIAENARRGGSLESIAGELRFGALLGKLNKIEAQLTALTAVRNSTASRNQRPFMSPVRWGRYVSRPQVETEIANAIFASHDPVPLLQVWGTGGFGKTWLAQNLCLSQQAMDHFEGGVLWIQLSEDRSLVRVESELERVAAELADVGRPLEDRGSRPSEAQRLARWVGELTDGIPTLMIIDDAWTEGHVEPFVDSLPPTCFRVITSRNQRAAPSQVPRLRVDAMQPAESIQLLRGQLDISDDDLEPLRKLCDDWPINLALVGGQLQWVVDQGGSVGDAVGHVLHRRREHGPTAFDRDRETGPTSPRNRTVRTTMETSLTFLGELHPGADERYLELCAFQDDSDVPREVIAKLWRRRAGLDFATSESLLLEFASHSLIQHFQLNPPAVRLHDVVREYLRHRAGNRLIAEISQDILRLSEDTELTLPNDGDPPW